MEENKISFLNSELDKWKKWFNSGAKKWGFAYHFCLYGTTIITLLIGFLTQIQFENFIGVSKDILIAFLAFVATGLSTLIAKGGLDRKWKSNIINRGKIELLKIEQAADNPDYKNIIEKLKTIITEHDLAIVGDSFELKEES